MHEAQRGQCRHEQAKQRHMRQQRHDQAEHVQRRCIGTAQVAPLGIRGVHGQGIVGEGPPIQPGHQQQRQQQGQAGHDPQRQGQQPAGDEQNRGKNAVDRCGDKTVLAHRRDIAILGYGQMLEQQGHDEQRREQRSSQVGAGEDRHPAAEISQDIGQPGDTPADQNGHRWMAEQPIHQRAQPPEGKPDPEQQRKQCRRQHVAPDPTVTQAGQRAHQGQHHLSHTGFPPIASADA